MTKNLLLSIVIIACLSACGVNNPPKTVGNTKDASASILPADADSSVVFSLSMISNLPAALCWPNIGDTVGAADSIINHITPIMSSTLQNATDPKNTSLQLSNWQIAWGPAVIAGQGDASLSINGNNAIVPVSSMTIFRETTDTNNYVVGIEATNPYCPFDWETLDLNVSNMVPWPGGAHGNLSMGTSIGLNNYILPLTDINQHTTAVQYIGNILKRNPGANIIVTGHSLGGALSPVFALYLKENNPNAHIICMSTAGASPGDINFCSYYNSVMQPTTIRVWNYLDVVPHAWVPDTMRLISNGIYATPNHSMFFDNGYVCDTNATPSPTFAFNGRKTPDDIKALIDYEIANSLNALEPKNQNHYGFICNNGTYFIGTGNPDSIYLDIAPDPLTKIWEKIFYTLSDNDDTFLSQLGNQHVAAYQLHYNIKGIHEYMRTKIQQCPYAAVNVTCTYPQPSAKNKKQIAAIKPDFKALWAAIHKHAWRY